MVTFKLHACCSTSVSCVLQCLGIRFFGANTLIIKTLPSTDECGPPYVYFASFLQQGELLGTKHGPVSDVLDPRLKADSVSCC